MIDTKNATSISPKKQSNYIVELAKTLSILSDKDPFWSALFSGYSKQVCFKNYMLDEICSSELDAKKWYKEQMDSGVFGEGGKLAAAKIKDFL